MICAAAPSKGACIGDSGGPLVWLDQKSPGKKVKLIGVTSFTTKNKESGLACDETPSVFTRVTAILYQEWKTKVGSATGEERDMAEELKDCNSVTCHKESSACMNA